MTRAIERLRCRWLVVPAAMLAMTAVFVVPALAGVATTKHNLSAGGTGTYKATSETEICIFCHAPHNTNAGKTPLWNRRMPTASYTPYSSTTLKSSPGQPNGASALCLSCHDGTIALGEVLSRTTSITMSGGALTGNSLLGTNLSDDHPVSFVFDAALRAARGELADPAGLVKPSAVRLDGAGRVQCTSCHDPHDDSFGKFLVASNASSALCQTCHTKNFWTSSSHRTATKTWSGTGTNPWPHTSGTTVAANACENCHRPHSAGGGPRLLNYASEEANCFPCHNGTVAAKNIESEMNKASNHFIVGDTGTHSPTETDPVAASHVECVDCHNPHATYATTLPTRTTTTALPALPGSLTGVRGVNVGGTAVNPATAEYEVCFRCHGTMVAARTTRVLPTTNTRLQFQTSNASFHPIAATGKSTSVPSLIAPWTTGSRMLCSDCHNNNAGPYSTGTGTTPSGTAVNGPHGSTIAPLLERNYTTTDGGTNSTGTTDSATVQALCYKCHSRTQVNADLVGSFREHSKHIGSGVNAPCNTCHDPHGVNSASANNARLINFRASVVTAAATGVAVRWERVGTTGGRCYLRCHGVTHNPYTY